MGVDTSSAPDLSTVEYEPARSNSVSTNTQILEQPEWQSHDEARKSILESDFANFRKRYI